MRNTRVIPSRNDGEESPAAARSPRTRRGFLAALGMTLVLAPQLFGAVSTSALTGRVMSGGVPAAGVTVTATSARLQAERTTVTGANGKYWLSALPPGAYEVTFSRTGLQTLSRRVTVQLARIVRADAVLEPSEDDEHVTSTTTTISVVHDTSMAVHETSKDLDRRPYRVTVFTPYALAPGITLGIGTAEVDGTPILSNGELVQSETADELTLFHGITPIELARADESAIVARTKTGGEELTVSVRDTISNGAWVADSFNPFAAEEGTRHYFESASGGRIIPNRLWFFGAGWAGKRADGIAAEPQGLELKLTAQLDARQNLTATWIDHETESVVGDFDSTLLSLVHVAQWTPHFLTEITAGRNDGGQRAPNPFPPLTQEQSTYSAKTAYVLGDHVVSGGAALANGDFGDTRSLFLQDRIWLQRFVLNAGIRYQDETHVHGGEEHITGQVAALYDLRGRGRNAISASASRYLVTPFDPVDELTLGYVMALGSTGSARLDLIRRERDDVLDVFLVQLDSSYRLFDRYEAGLNYTWCDTRHRQPIISPLVVEHSGNAWFSAEVPVGAHAIGGTIAYRYRAYPSLGFPLPDYHSIDAGLRYTFPLSRIGLTLAADALNLTDSGDGAFPPRTVRGWIRARL